MSSGRGSGNRISLTVSLHVWADNVVAQDFYKARGFISLGVVDVAPHARLPHIGGSMLMRKMISSKERGQT
jgi:hypothetical protein